jgi:prepilin-type N-terminal cleavage/methylation domain-containing protein
MIIPIYKLREQQGFTLIEMSMVLFIVALLLGGLLPTISSQVEQRHVNDTRKQLDEIQQALIGFAIVNGRLPCPAKPTIATTDTTNSPGTEICTPTMLTTGVLPWVTLGISETDSWGRRFTYTATSAFIKAAPTFTLASNGTLTVKSAAGGSNVASSIPAVVVSHGTNGSGAYTSQGTQITASNDPDEADNSNGGTTFVSHFFTPTFDDLVVWISPNILMNRMVAAGKLP